MKVTHDTTVLAVKAVLCSATGAKLGKLVPDIPIVNFGIMYNDVKEIIDNVIKIFEFSNETPEFDLVTFFNSGNWGKLTVSEYIDSCYDLLVHKASEANKEFEWQKMHQ